MSKNILPLKENTTHGSLSFPCACYHALSSAFPFEHPFLCAHHWHEEIEVLYFEEGPFLLEVGMEKYQISRKCICFINSAEMHALSCDQDYSEYAIVFLPSMLNFSENDAVQKTLIQPLINNELAFPRFIYEEDPLFHEILPLIQRITAICKPDPLYMRGNPPTHISVAGQLHIKASLLAMLALLADANLLTADISSKDRRVDVLKESITYMREHYSEKIYISDLANLANMNEQYYCRFFKKAIGKTPIEYLNEMRIQRSMRLLQSSQKSVLEVSLECGFNNLGNYMRTFKKVTGTTPLQYRKSFLA
ncbi:MAG: helix-turn-helix transcriptional regulator [Muricoprocola sp.]